MVDLLLLNAVVAIVALAWWVRVLSVRLAASDQLLEACRLELEIVRRALPAARVHQDLADLFKKGRVPRIPLVELRG